MNKKKNQTEVSSSNKAPLTPLIHSDMIINDVVGLFPEAAEIMLSYGLHCIGCGASGFETIYEGMVGHGFPEEDMSKMVDELNRFATELVSDSDREAHRKAKPGTLTMTPKAQRTLIAVAEQEGKNDWGVKLQVFLVNGASFGSSEKSATTAPSSDFSPAPSSAPSAPSSPDSAAEHSARHSPGCCDIKYSLDFVQKPLLTDKVVGVAKGVTVIVPKDQWELVAGCEIDYVERVDASGFKVNNPNKKPCACKKEK